MQIRNIPVTKLELRYTFARKGYSYLKGRRTFAKVMLRTYHPRNAKKYQRLHFQVQLFYQPPTIKERWSEIENNKIVATIYYNL